MSTVNAFFEAVNIAFSWPTFGFMILGLLLGMFFGSLPGIGSSLGMAIILPLTLPLEGISAIILLVSIYSGAMYGGSIAAILVNVPGTAAAAATTFDGYPMSKQGKAKNALALSATSSALGGFLTIIALFLVSPVLVEIVLLFGSPEYFLIALLGLSMITIVSQGSIVKGLTAGFFGLLLTTIGIAPVEPTLRYTYGWFALRDGLSYVAGLIGLFAITEMLILASEQGGISDADISIEGSLRDGVRDALSHPVHIVKSAFLGMGIGAIPGSGASVSNFIAYGEAMRASENPDEFGEGNPEGVIASEASNNGTVGGSLIPTLSFGIPGSGSTAVLLGGLIMHGLIPGPDLFSTQLPQTFSLFVALLVGNVIILGIGLSVITRLSYITQIDTHYIIPTILVLATLGALALRNNWVDVFTILALGFIGFYMRQHNYSIIAFVLGIVLGPIAEQNLLRSLQLSGGSLDIFIEKPLSLVLVVAIILILVGPFAGPRLRKLVSQLG
jgi:putative tricarboxylic transport membrane protein